MARYAMVHTASSFVANVVVIDDIAAWPVPEGYTMVEDTEVLASPGYTYVDGKFVPPPSVVAEEPAA